MPACPGPGRSRQHSRQVPERSEGLFCSYSHYPPAAKYILFVLWYQNIHTEMRKDEHRVFLGLEAKETAQFAVLVISNKLFLQISAMQTKDDSKEHPSHKPLSHSRGLQMTPPSPVPELLPVSAPG